jgi:glycyl-tRNA synthetase beta chain
MPELLFEILSEEIPARMQSRAAADLERLMNERLLGAGFLPEGVKAFATPRRLALLATGLPRRQPDRKEEKKGPRVGAPEKAVEGFLKSAGLASLDQCEVRNDKKGAYYVAVIDEKGRDTSEVLRDVAPNIIREFPWPKSMRWGEGELRWVRPIHSILCAFDGEIVPMTIDGIASGDETRGHRFMSAGAIRARSFETYASRLKAAKVLLERDERMAHIAAEAKTLCEAQGLRLVEDPTLLGEVAGLAEWPVVMMGTFEEKFLALPDEVLTAVMRGHQKYFSVANPKTGRLANKFVFVANIEAPDGGAAMRPGYERVLTARLSDAWYLYNKDLKTPLEDRLKDLDRVTFFEGLGSVGDKARRMAALARDLAPKVGADPQQAEQTALLAKADLTTGMVYEFPELQGIMGRYYAIDQGVPSEIADAIRDHYKPKGAEDDLPTAPVSVAVALADKIDTLTAFWAIGKKPTGSSDPFALRRAALGVISLLLSRNYRTVLNEVISRHSKTQLVRGAQADIAAGQALFGAEPLLAFFHDRLKVYLRDTGHRHDHIDAVLAKADGSPEDDLTLIVMKLKALESFLETDDGSNLVAAYKRAANILKAEEKKDGTPAGADVIAESRLALPEEKALHAALRDAETRAGAAVAAERFADAMSALATLRRPVDAFFDKVTVNDPDPALRANRLALLARLRSATARVADLAKLEG